MGEINKSRSFAELEHTSHWKPHISLEVNSKDRTRGTTEDFFLSLNNQITFSQKPSKSYYLRLENVLMPNTYYSVDSNFNVFQVLEDDGVGGDDTITITLDQGNYTITELLTELESQLDTNTMNANDYTLTYDDITNKITISFTGGSADITIDTIANGSTLNQLIGFGIPDTATITGGDNQIVVLAGAGNATEAPNCVDLALKSYITIITSLSSNNYYNNGNQEHLGVRVPMSVDRNIREIFLNHQGHRALLNNKGPISVLEFRLRDPFGNDVDLNGCQYSFEMNIYELTK